MGAIVIWLVELLAGLGLLWQGAKWLGYLDRWRTIGSMCAVFGGLALVIHGGISLLGWVG